MRKLLSIILTLAIVATCFTGFAGCSKEDGTDVVFLYNGPVQFFQELSDALSAKFTQEGYTYESAHAGFNSATQNDQIENYTTKGVKLMVLMAVDANSAKSAAKAAKDAGVNVIAFTVDLGRENQTFYMGSNEGKIGETVAIIGSAWEKHKAVEYTADDVLVIGNRSNDASILRTDEIAKGIENLLDIKLKSNNIVNWSKETAEVTTNLQNWVTGTNGGKIPKLILCYNSDMALGVDAYLMSDSVKNSITLADYCVVGSDAGSIVGKIMGPMENTAIRGIASLDGVEGIVEEVWSFGGKLLRKESCPSENLAIPFALAGSWYKE